MGIKRVIEDDLLSWVREYRAAKRVVKESSTRSNEVRDRIKARIAADERAYESDGHRWLDVSGIPGVKAVKLQRGTSVSYNTERLQALLEELGLWKPVSEGGVLRYLPQIDTDQLEALRYQGKIDPAALATTLDEKTTESLILVEDK